MIVGALVLILAPLIMDGPARCLAARIPLIVLPGSTSGSAGGVPSDSVERTTAGNHIPIRGLPGQFHRKFRGYVVGESSSDSAFCSQSELAVNPIMVI